MKRFYLDDYAAAAESCGLMDCDLAAHAMRKAVNDLNLDDESGFGSTHVVVMDFFIINSHAAPSLGTIIRGVKGIHYYTNTKADEVREAIDDLNKARFLRKRRLSSGRIGYELAYLTRGES